MKLRLLFPVLLLSAAAPWLRADDTAGFVEKYALAADRGAVLAQLIPGSEEYYFYHALQYQNTRQKEKLTALLQQWAKRFENSSQRRIIENREALLSYDADPQATLKFLRERLGLSFNHQQEVRDQKPDLPTALDPKLISREAYLRDSIADSDNLDQFHDAALEALVRDRTPLNPAQIRAVLSRLKRPDVPNLVDLVEANLRTKESRGFGEFEIHRALLPEQLDELAARRPSLYTEQAFVYARLRKLAPGAEADPEFEPAEREAWLDRAWAYAAKLAPAFNSLKASILYQRLRLDQARGVYDEKRFLTYLKLPRRAAYVSPRFAEAPEHQRGMIDLNANFREAVSIAPAIGNDEALVRDFFLHLFARGIPDQKAAPDPEAALAPWLPYVRDTWLRPVFAEAMITAGLGDPEHWASWLNPTAYQRLKERVDIDFSPLNPQFFAPGEEVNLEVILKNAPRMIVKVYEINTLSYFLSSHQQLNTDLTLDGLVANRERTEDFSAEPAGRGPWLRAPRTFHFPELKGKRGAWVIEFIGGGKSSRALVRKGQWRVVQRSGPAGDLLTVLDEAGQPVKDAVAWLDGRKFATDDKTGAILIPYTQQPGTKAVVLADPAGAFATLAPFEHHAEAYRLEAQFHVVREQLLAGRPATLVLRPDLFLGAAPVSLGLLGDARLTLVSTTLDGVSTSTEVKAPKLEHERDFTYDFTVPARLAKLTATLTGTVENLSHGGEKQTLTATHEWELNGIDRTAATDDGRLSRFGDAYVYELLGRNGEPMADRQIVFQFYHRDFVGKEEAALRTDEKGRVMLGRLAGIERLEAAAPAGGARQWRLSEALQQWPHALHGRAGEAVPVPIPPGALEFSLLEQRGGTFSADRRAAVRREGGFFYLEGLAPGDYSLRLRGEETEEITVRITAGQPVAGWLVAPNRALEQRHQATPLQIVSTTVGPESIAIQLANWDDHTRVHITATRFLPDESLLTLGDFTRPEPAWSTPDRLPALYAPGRRIGDEYRYILERKYAKIFPGNMLTRPGLLLNPWETRSTDLEAVSGEGTEKPQAMAAARAGGQHAPAAPPAPAEAKSEAPVGESGTPSENLDYLATAAPAGWNLAPDAQGRVRIARASLGDRQHVQVLAENPDSAIWRTFALPEAGTKFIDLRLRQSLDPALDLAQKKEATVLAAGQTLALAHRTESELELYDSLAAVFTLFTTLSHDETLAKFAWILQWPTLKEEEKRAKYSEFACHELNLFLSRKDPEFFRRVIAPYLANKKEKAFLDEYLLEAPLQRWLTPWSYEQLNVAERCLLAQRLPGEAAATARHLAELRDLLPPDPKREDWLFQMALNGRALQEEVSPVSSAAPEQSVTREPATTSLGLINYAGGTVMNGGTLRFAGRIEAEKSLKDVSKAMPVAAPMPALEREKRADFDDLGKVAADATRRQVRAYFRALGPAKEWAENQYYHVSAANRTADLITINDFWRDYAGREGAGAFVSPHFPQASRNFPEMMLALAVLDLPFTAPKHTVKSEGDNYSLTAAGPLVAFHQEIEAAAPAKENAGLLVTQNFFREDDRYREEGNERFDKYVTAEFLTGVVYGATVVVTNPTSSPQKLRLLLQIPQGALPVLGNKATDSPRVELAAYTTQTFEYHFYFPAPSPAEHPFTHYPVHASRQEESAGAARPSVFKVVRQLSEVNRATWEYVSQYGTEVEVIAWLKGHNLQKLDLDRIAWRARKSAAFFRQVVALLTTNHCYSSTLWSYAVYHNDSASLREFLRHQKDFIAECGPALRSKLLEIDPTERRSYEHLEYSPLVNQRAHRFTAENRIPNPVLRQQYKALLGILTHRPALEPMDELSVVYYLFLQDRVEEALARFHALKPEALPTRLQYDYLRCYAALCEEKLPEARALVQQYAQYPVDRWRRLFAEAGAQLDEIAGAAAAHPGAGPAPDREAQQAGLAATEPTFDFKVENRRLELTWKNLPEVTVNYYLMEPEFLFSSSPFVTEDPARFSIIKPTRSEVQKLPAGQDALELPLPPEFAKANVLVEILGAGQRRAQAYHAHTLKLTVAENYGRLEVREQAGPAIAKAYVKVYARLRNGTVRFYRDGYTDLRGRFDYASQNSSETPAPPMPLAREEGGEGSLSYQPIRPGELGEVEKFAILVLSETHGAVVREAAAPAP